MRRLTTLFGMLAIVASAGMQATADDKPETAEIKSTIGEDSVKSCIGACHVNFRKDLGVTLQYLDSIGYTIHEARKTPDPVQLALCAKGLSVAEQVAGKKASVTADQVMQEAIQLARLRGFSAELSAVAKLTDKETSADLNELAEAAKEAEAADREATEQGETSKELVGTLRVENHSHECLRIFVDGRYVGTVHEGHTRSFHVHAHNWHNHFDAYCEEGGELVQHADYSGHAHHLNWHIH